MRAIGVVAAAMLAAGCFSSEESGGVEDGGQPPEGDGSIPGTGDPLPTPGGPGAVTPAEPAPLLAVDSGITTSVRPCAGGWCWWNFPRGSAVTHMWGSGANDVWATTGLGGMLHWDGASWSAEWLGTVYEPGPGVPPIYVGFALGGVWGKSASQAWTIDWMGDVLRWDGARWLREPGLSFHAASWPLSSSDGVAWAASSSDLRRFDGAATEVHACPLPEFGTVGDIWAAGPDDVFAVRKTYGASGHVLGVLRYRQGSCEERALSGALTLPTTIGSISGSGPDDVWVSAFSHWSGRSSLGDGSAPASTLWRFDGAEWQAQDPAISGPVFVAARDDVWTGRFHLAGGTWTEVPDAPEHLLWSAGADDVWGMRTGDVSGALVHWDGQRWTPRAHLGGELRVIGRNLAPADDAWVLAPMEDGGAELVRWDGTVWVQVPGSRLAPEHVRRLETATHGSSGSDVWLAHVDGYLHWDGGRWTLTPLDLSGEAAWPLRSRARLEKLTGTGPEDVWASNPAGVFHWDGSAWTARGSPGEVHAIWTPRRGLLFALGYEVTRPEAVSGSSPYWADLQQVMWRWTSAGWSEEFRGATYVRGGARDTSGWHGAMWGARPDDAWAILGYEGAYRWDGERWTRSDGPLGAQCIWGPSADDVWVVSDRWSKALDASDRMHWNGQSWEHYAQMPVPLMCGSGAWASHRGGLWQRQVSREPAPSAASPDRAQLTQHVE